jgi:nitroimidazol reductase NimA-like FMN-containing flavoprotein (pyridoxamine 5'-phosphate oxidase superfamily)
MRRSEREVTDSIEILSIIKACDVMRLAMVDETGRPYIIPLNFGWETIDGVLTLYFHCACEGRKLDILRHNPKVCFEMDTDHRLTTAEKPCGYSFGYKSVIGWGEVVLLETHEDKSPGLQAIMRHAGRADASFTPADTQKVCVGRLTVDCVTGKSHP